MTSDVYKLEVDLGNGFQLIAEISDLTFGRKIEKPLKHYDVSGRTPRVDLEDITVNRDAIFILRKIENQAVFERIAPKSTGVEGNYNARIRDNKGTDVFRASGIRGNVKGIFVLTNDLPSNSSASEEWVGKEMVLQLTYSYQRTY